MKQYNTHGSGIQVKGEIIVSAVKKLGLFKEKAMEILNRNGIANPQKGQWYPQYNFLRAMHEISSTFSGNEHFVFNATIPDLTGHLPQFCSLNQALNSVNLAFDLIHSEKTSDNYKLLFFSYEERYAIVEFSNPYPDEFNQAFISNLARQFNEENTEIIVSRTLGIQKEEFNDNSGKRLYCIFW